ncbi:MAG: alpha/beta hydrolase [Pseudomonadota bacterium]
MLMNIDPTLFHDSAVEPETAAFNAWLESELAKGPALHQVEPQVLRDARARGEGLLPSGGPLEGSNWVDAPTEAGLARITEPEGRATGLYIHIHGGGWTIGTPEMRDDWFQQLAREIGCVCVSLKYRLAPEDPWPACADDCEAGAVWCIETLARDYGVNRIAIGGESAGAHLSAVTLQRLRARGKGDRVHGALLHYGVFDLGLTPSAANWGARNMILSTPTIQWFADNLTGGDRDLARDAALSPLKSDLTAMPPALFQVGTLDPLLDDTLFMAQRWAAAGSLAELEVYPGGVHAFDLMDIPIAKRSRTSAAKFLNGVFTS